MRAFLAAVRKGSITTAASNIQLSQSAVTKRIAALEGQLGAPLSTAAGAVSR